MLRLKYRDLQRSVDYYQQIIGFQVLEQSENKAALTTDGKTSILSLVQPDNVERAIEKTTGLYHFAILLPMRADLANIVAHLQSKEVFILVHLIMM